MNGTICVINNWCTVLSHILQVDSVDEDGVEEDIDDVAHNEDILGSLNDVASIGTTIPNREAKELAEEPDGCECAHLLSMNHIDKICLAKLIPA